MNTPNLNKAYAAANAEIAKEDVQASFEAAKNAAEYELEAGKDQAAAKEKDAKEKIADEKSKIAATLKGVTKKALDYSADAAEFIAEKSRNASAKL